MSSELVRAHLNLGAVLKNLEVLGDVDPEAAQLTEPWRVAVQFTVAFGPEAWLEYSATGCRQDLGRHTNPDVRLLFATPRHLNRMFDGTALPIPLTGFTRLGFLKDEFPKATARLEAVLKPKTDPLEDPALLAANTALTLYTGAFAVRALAATDPVSAGLAAGAPAGTLQLQVLPDGPAAWVSFGKDGVSAGRGLAEAPAARMTFKDLKTAYEVLGGKRDGMSAIGQGDVEVWGMLPLVDSATLIMDRVARFLD